MQATMTGRLVAFDDAIHTADFVMLRRTKEGPVEEPLKLRFTSELSYQGFRARHATGESLLLIGRLSLARVPVLRVDGTTGGKKPKALQGRDMMTHRLELWVKDHRALPGLVKEAVESDIVVVTGFATLLAPGELKVTESGLPWFRGRVATQNPKKAGLEQPSDYYDVVSYGPLAERMAKMQAGEQFLIEWAGVANPACQLESRDGVLVWVHTPELVVRDIRYLPRVRDQVEQAVEA